MLTWSSWRMRRTASFVSAAAYLCKDLPVTMLSSICLNADGDGWRLRVTKRPSAGEGVTQRAPGGYLWQSWSQGLIR